MCLIYTDIAPNFNLGIKRFWYFKKKKNRQEYNIFNIFITLKNYNEKN